MVVIVDNLKYFN